MTRPTTRERGLTLIELIVAAAIMAILAAAALPLFEVSVRRGREIELRRALRVMRQAIDQFHVSYVASGGQTSQGPTVLRGVGQPGQAGQARPGGASGGPRASQPLGSGPGNNPAANRRNRGAAGGGQQPAKPPIPLIDVSQFDPIDSKGYPPDLKTLAEGVQAFGGTSDELVKFFRRVPIDPMISTDNIDPSDPNYGWGVRSYQDDLDATVWGRQNVYDVYSYSNGTALDGSKYRDW